jgi:hypothetical protein
LARTLSTSPIVGLALDADDRQENQVQRTWLRNWYAMRAPSGVFA